MKKLNSILTEAARVLGAVAFWSVALPVAALLLPVAAFWNRTGGFPGKGVIGGTSFRTAPVAAV